MIGVKMNMVKVQLSHHSPVSSENTYTLDNGVILIVPQAAALVGVNPDKVKAISIIFYQATRDFDREFKS